MDPNSEGWKALKQFSSRTELLRTTAVEGTVHLGKIKFSAEGHNNLLLTSMPITVSDHVGVKHEPDFKPSERMVRASDARDDRTMYLVRSLKKLEEPRIEH